MADYVSNELVRELAYALSSKGIIKLKAATQAAVDAAVKAAADAATAAAANAQDMGAKAQVAVDAEAKAKGMAGLVDDFADLADLPDLAVFAGYLGGAVKRKPGGEEWRLLYLDWQLTSWLLLRQDDIILHKQLKDETAPFKLRDVLWVSGDARVTQGTGPQSAEARFLRGTSPGPARSTRR